MVSSAKGISHKLAKEIGHRRKDVPSLLQFARSGVSKIVPLLGSTWIHDTRCRPLFKYLPTP